MSSEIRVNKINNRSGLSTVTFTNTGPIISGVTTFQDRVDFESNGLNVTSGSVGIGTDNPISNLHVLSDTNTTIRIENADDSEATIYFRNTGTADRKIVVASADMIFYGGGAASIEHVRIKQGGRVGIGTDNPDEKLHVSGGNIKVDSGYGIDFSATAGPDTGTGTSELLDDYEEGTFTMTLSAGGNTSDQECRYTKIGRVVYIDGHGNSEDSNFFNTGSQSVDTAVTITTNLPFTPVRTGAAPITVSRTLKGANGFLYERMYVGWRSGSATIYLGSEANQYNPNNNIVTSSTQTNKTLLFSGYFVTEV